MQPPPVFELLKKKNPKKQQSKSTGPFYFQMVIASKSARLLVVDKEGVEQFVSFQDHVGHQRSILKTLEMIQQQSSREIKWSHKEPGIDLTEHSFLLWQLKKCDNFVDEQLRPIRFSTDRVDLHLQISGISQLECRYTVKIDGEMQSGVQLISEHHLLFNQTIYGINETGTDYQTLCSFETLIFPVELEKYLSLFLTYCENIPVHYLNYEIRPGHKIKTTPTLTFEKVLPDGSLYLKVTESLPGLDPGFLNQYDLSKSVSVDHHHQKILVHRVQTGVEEQSQKLIFRELNELKKGFSDEEAGFYQDEALFIIENPLSEQFVQKTLPKISHRFALFGAERLKPYRVVQVQPELSVKFDHGIDFFEGNADLIISGESFSLFEALHQFNKNSYIQLNDGTKAILNHEYIEKLERLFQKKGEQAVISFYDLPLLEELLEDRFIGDTIQDRQKIYKGFLDLKDKAPHLPPINATLRPYQIEGFKWLDYLHQHSLGGCLADDMGLGKTLQTITMLSSIYPKTEKPSLIVVPKSLIFNWQNELSRFNPNLKLCIYYGPERDLGSTRDNHLILTTYGVIRNEIEQLKEESFHYLILDESQTIKNHESQIARAVSILNAEVRLALSGTPIENNITELYSLFRFLNPAMFGNLASFTRKYLLPIQTGNREVAEELKKKIYPFILRRLKKDVLTELPDKVEQTLFVEMSDEQRRFYEQRRSFYYETVRQQVQSEGAKKSQFFVLQAITALRQIASIPEVKSEGQIISPKREVLLEHLDEALANNHKVLIFANFLGILEVLAEQLKLKQIDFETLTGATRNREIHVNRFQNDPECRVFLMTLKAGGQGLNLTAADMVYIFDPWWNIAAENQAIDRSHRMGQDRTVFCYKMITKGTIEEKILHLQKKKKNLFETIISDESMSYSFLNEDDIDYLMG